MSAVHRAEMVVEVTKHRMEPDVNLGRGVRSGSTGA
jgi:hypothetical protein